MLNENTLFLMFTFPVTNYIPTATYHKPVTEILNVTQLYCRYSTYGETKWKVLPIPNYMKNFPLNFHCTHNHMNETVRT